MLNSLKKTADKMNEFLSEVALKLTPKRREIQPSKEHLFNLGQKKK